MNPTLDLWFERKIDIPPERVWTAWRQPEFIKQWFTPAPWTTVDCKIDLRPGGIFRTVEVIETESSYGPTRQAHADLGFEQGWGAALDQLVALMKAQLGQDK